MLFMKAPLFNQSAKADSGKPKLSLVPTEIINCIAKCREFGVAKYHNPDNWKDVEKERYIDAAYRHWIKYVENHSSVDEESGLPHLWHCACNIAFLCEFDKVARQIEQLKSDIAEQEQISDDCSNCIIDNANSESLIAEVIKAIEDMECTTGIGISDVCDDVAQKEIKSTYEWLQQPVKQENTSGLIQRLNWLRNNADDKDVKNIAIDAIRTIERQEYIINSVRSRKHGKFE